MGVELTEKIMALSLSRSATRSLSRSRSRSVPAKRSPSRSPRRSYSKSPMRTNSMERARENRRRSRSGSRGDPRVHSKYHNNDIGRHHPELDSRTLFCKGIPFDLSEDDLLNYEMFRRAVGIRIVMHPQERRTQGFGFILFESKEDAREVYDRRHDCRMGGRNLLLDFVGERSRHGTYKGHPDDRRRDRRSPSPRRGRSPRDENI